MPRPRLARAARRAAAVVAVLAAIAGAAAALVWFVVIPARVDRALAAAAAAARDRDAVPVDLLPATALASGRGDIAVLGATGEARDGLAAFGRLWIATPGGLLVHDDRGRHLATLTWREGLASADVTTLARFRTWLVAGHGDGRLTLIDGDTAQIVRFGLARPAPITALAADADGQRLWIGTRGAGLLEWDGRRARRVPSAEDAPAADDITALALSPTGTLAVGTAQGHVLRLHGRSLATGAAGAPSAGPDAAFDAAAGPVTALAWDGDDLWVGRPLGLTHLAADGTSRTVRGDLFVTALLVDPAGGRVWAATFDRGVTVVRGAAAGAPVELERLGRVAALRLVADRPAAFGAAGATALAEAGPRPLVAAPPAALPGPHVTALAMFHGELWVGTFEHGLARVTLDGAARGAAPLPAAYGLAQVNQLEPRAQPALELVLATARGLVHLDAHGGARRVTRADGLAGEQVAAVAARGERAAVATNRGLTLLDPTTGPRSLGPVQGLANAHATAVVWLDDRHLAVGTLGGLTFVRAAPGETPRVERTVGAGPGALPAGWVSALAATPEGLYVGTYGGGLALVAPDGALVPLPAPTRGRVRVNPGAIFVTDEAVLVGTLDHGLLVVDRASRRVSPAALPLGSANVTAVAVAGDALWVGTDQGLVRVAAPARFAAR